MSIKECKVVLSSLCRVCLKPGYEQGDEVMLNIFNKCDFFQSEVYKIMIQFAHVEASVNDKLSPYICQHCLGLLKNAWTLKIMCEASYKTQCLSLQYQSDAFDIVKIPTTPRKLGNSSLPNILVPLNGSFLCLGCQKPFALEENLISHYETCSLKSFANSTKNKRKEEVLVKHSSPMNGSIETNSDMQRCEFCTTCNVHIPKEINFRAHVKSKLHRTIYSKKKFNASQRYHHIKYNNVSVLHKSPQVIAQLQMRCKVCNQMCSKKSFSAHLKTHSNIKHVCCICNKSYSRIDSLIFHIETHGTNLRYKCNKCTAKYPSARSLYLHEKMHSNYKCQYCNRQFHTLKGQNQHNCLKRWNKFSKTNKTTTDQATSHNLTNSNTTKNKPKHTSGRNSSTNKQVMSVTMDEVQREVFSTKNDINVGYMPLKKQKLTWDAVKNVRSCCALCLKWFPSREDLSRHFRNVHL